MRRRDRWEIETIDLTTKRYEEDKQVETSGVKAIVKRHWKKSLIILGVIYLIVVLFGVFSARYYYDENGNRRLYRLTFADMQLQDDYDTLSDQLTSIRGILTDVAIVDIHLANGKYTNYEAATLYSEILNGQLDVLIPKINSMNLQKEQEPIRETMESLLSYDLALYLQNITAGLKSGDAKTVQTALEYREKSLKTYDILEDSLRTISDNLKLNDGAYYAWDLYESAKRKDGSAVFVVKGDESDEQ